FISWLLGRLGYELKEQNYKTPDGKKARAYVLDYDDKVKTQPYFDVIDRLLTARFERAVLAPKDSTIPKNEPKIDQIDFEDLDPPQSLTGHGVEAVPDHPNKIKKMEDHLEPIQQPITTAQSTTANKNDWEGFTGQELVTGDWLWHQIHGRLTVTVATRYGTVHAVSDDGLNLDLTHYKTNITHLWKADRENTAIA
ncbi:MAG: hypothetical protein ACKOX2_12520, partial [Microcystaceae cyanobacterium]